MNKFIFSSLIKNYKNIPNKIAVIDAEGEYTYEKLVIDCLHIAIWLNSNLKQGSRVGVLLDNSYQAVVAMYGIFFQKVSVFL